MRGRLADVPARLACLVDELLVAAGHGEHALHAEELLAPLRQQMIRHPLAKQVEAHRPRLLARGESSTLGRSGAGS